MKQEDLFGTNKSNIEKLNISKCLTFRRCPFEYKLRYLEKGSFRWESRINMNLGIFLHELINQYFKKKIIHKEQETIIELFNSKWEKEKSKFKDYQKEYHNKCKSIINLFLDSPISHIYPLAAEYKFGKLIKKDLYITGRIDLVGKMDNNIQIWEFKLDESEISLIDQEYKKYFQLIFYYYGIADTFGAIPRNLGYYFFSSGKFTSIKVYSDLLERGFQEIENTLGEMKNTREFIPRINNYCPSCGYNNICPNWKSSKEKEI